MPTASVLPSAARGDAAVPPRGCAGLLTPILSDADTTGTPGGVTYRSRGVVLLVGDGIEVLAPARALAERMQVVAFAPGLQAAGTVPRNLVVVGGRIVSVTGHLGCFRARAATGAAEHRDMGPFSPNADGGFDLVLDLSKVPLIQSAVKPYGYFAPGVDDLDAALEQLPRLIGAFRQPRHIDFQSSLCTHSRQGLTGCTRCIQVCDAGAVRSNANVISVDASLCQGCAACTLACPTGALSFRAPTRPELMDRLKKMLRESAAAGAPNPVLLVHLPHAALPEELPPEVRALEVPALPAFGDELWLAALAAGVRAVLLLDDEALSGGTRVAIEQALVQTRALAAAAGCANAVIALVAPDQLTRTLAALPTAMRKPHWHTFEPVSDAGHKREAALQALCKLSSGQVMRPAPLPAGAAFGSVRVNRGACTLCLACVNLCPPGALKSNGETVRRLEFNESACVQCGLCVSGCPEHALALQPRTFGFSGPAGTATVLAEDEMVRCTECRKPFIGRKVLTRSLSTMEGATGFQGQSQKLLYQCAECRSRSMFA